MKIRRWLLVTAVILAATAIAVAGQRLVLGPIVLSVAQEQSDVTVRLFGLGTIEARVLSKVGFKVSGALAELTADQGDGVPKGAILARLDSREQEARVARASANVTQATANLNKARAGVEKSRSVLVNAQRIDERRRTLVQKGNVSIEAADAAEAAKEAAAADLALALAEVEVARAALKDSEAQHRLESATLDLHTLIAPYPSKIVTRHKELGSILQSGEAVFTLIDADSVWALAYIDESRAGDVRLGQPAEIILRSQPNAHLTGRVARIDIEADRVNEERRVFIAFDRPLEDFHLGEQAEIYISIAHLDRALLVPEAAVEIQGESRGMVWTIEDGRLERRQILLGHRLLDGARQIADGVPAGAQVVSRASTRARVGRRATAAQSKLP